MCELLQYRNLALGGVRLWSWADNSSYAAVTLPQVKNALALLPSPYLHNGLMVVINQTTQMIDSTGWPVPLSEVQPAALASASQHAAASEHTMWKVSWLWMYGMRASGDAARPAWRARADGAGARRSTCTTTWARPPC